MDPLLQPDASMRDQRAGDVSAAGAHAGTEMSDEAGGRAAEVQAELVAQIRRDKARAAALRREADELDHFIDGVILFVLGADA